MKKKIMKTMLFVSSLLLVLFSVLTLRMIERLRSILVENAEKSGHQVEGYSDKAMKDQIMERLNSTTMGCAFVVDETLQNFAGTITIIADSATDIYSNPDRYGRAEVNIPQKSDIGRSMGQFVFANGVDPTDADVQEELSMIGNLQGNLLAMYDQYPELGASYIGTETGLMLLAGPVLAERWDSAGRYDNFDPRKRPWYTGAKITRSTHFSEITEDYDTGKLAIMCGSPVYRGTEFVGVVGAGVYLEGIEALMMNARLTDEGESCIIDEHGRIIFSSKQDGELKPQTKLGEETDNAALMKLAKRAKMGESDIELLSIDGEMCYAAFYPISTVGWSLMSIIPETIVLAPKESLLGSLIESRNDELKEVQDVLGAALVTMLVIIVVMGVMTLIVVSLLTKRIVRPIEILTNKVQKLDGDQLEFHWDTDTGDEVQKLATSFGYMTERMKKYIVDIQAATAEKERIGAELSLATRIQTAMLPHDFPPFPDRSEFEVYAMMEPARQVGGDFYDFFLIDDDHLGLVMADVAGKGIPAALYMMTAKTTLQSCALLGKSAAEVLEKTNEALVSKNHTDMFVTTWFGILEISSGKLTCANAGHEYPALMRNGGNFEVYLDKHSFVIGGLEHVKYKEYTITLGHGDKLFLYTDGVAEASDKNDMMYGTDRMVLALNKDAKGDVESIIKNVREDISRFVGDAEQFDDMTMMCLEYK